MALTPGNAPPELIDKLSEAEAADLAHEKIVSDYQRALRMLGNPETVLTPKPEIDLRGKDLDVRYQLVQGGWCAWDANRYDGAPDASGADRIIGYGPEKEDALTDLLERTAEYAAEHPRTRASVPIYTSGRREEPNDYSDRPEPEQHEDDE